MKIKIITLILTFVYFICPVYAADVFEKQPLNPPTTAGNTIEKWSVKLSENWSLGTPVISGNYIYISSNDVLMKINKHNGEIKGQLKLNSVIGFFSNIAIKGSIALVPLKDGSIQAVDIESMSLMWQTESVDFQLNTPITVYNDYFYYGFTTASSDKGMYVCRDFNGNKLWEYGECGYYWSGAAVCKEWIIFGGDDGKVVVHHATEDIYDTFQADGQIRSTIFYDDIGKNIFFATKKGLLYSIKVSDGKFNINSVKSTFIGENITSSPIEYNGRIYIGGGGLMCEIDFSVLDGKTLDLIYTAPIKTQSTPTIYVDDKDIYVYVLANSPPDNLYILKDKQGQNSADFEIAATPSMPQYNSSSVIIDEDSIYFKNDSGYLFAYIKSGNPPTKISQIANIAALVIGAYIVIFWLRDRAKRKLNEIK